MRGDGGKADLPAVPIRAFEQDDLMPPLGGGGGGHEPGGSGSHDDHPARRFRLRDGGHGGFPARERVEGAGDGDHLVGVAHAALPAGHAGADLVLAPGGVFFHQMRIRDERAAHDGEVR